jgi:hypothetical protein
MRWTSVLTYGSAVALLAALGSQLLGWSAARSWFLLIWAVFLLPAVIGLFRHPMRWPAWGVFVGFWGGVGVVLLIVVQVLALWDVLRGPAYGGWSALPLALIGLWILVASSLGFGGEPFPRVVDGLGILTGIGLLAIAFATWVSGADAARVAAVATVPAYCLWAFGAGFVFWRLGARSPGREAISGTRAPALPQH